MYCYSNIANNSPLERVYKEFLIGLEHDLFLIFFLVLSFVSHALNHTHNFGWFSNGAMGIAKVVKYFLCLFCCRVFVVVVVVIAMYQSKKHTKNLIFAFGMQIHHTITLNISKYLSTMQIFSTANKYCVCK